MAKKKQLKEIHGKVEEPATKPTMLEQIWGYNESSKFGTTDRNEFVGRLADMNRPDLEAFARSKGIMIVEDTMRLRNSILKEFDMFLSSLQRPISKTKPVESVSDAAKRILSEGR